MSKPSLKVLSFKERVSEKIAQFLDDPLSLRDLAYARYRRFSGDSVYHSADYHRKRSERLKAEHFSRKHKKHVMHAQHRTNCVNVFKFLKKDKPEKQSTGPASKDYGNAHIQKMRRRRSGSEPPD